MHCMRLWIPLFLLPLPATSPFFLVLFVVAYALQTRPCAYCSAIIVGTLLSICSFYPYHHQRAENAGAAAGRHGASPLHDAGPLASAAPLLPAAPGSSSAGGGGSQLRASCWINLEGRYLSTWAGSPGGWFSTMPRANRTVLAARYHRRRDDDERVASLARGGGGGGDGKHDEDGGDEAATPKGTWTAWPWPWRREEPEVPGSRWPAKDAALGLARRLTGSSRPSGPSRRPSSVSRLARPLTDWLPPSSSSSSSSASSSSRAAEAAEALRWLASSVPRALPASVFVGDRGLGLGYELVLGWEPLPSPSPPAPPPRRSSAASKTSVGAAEAAQEGRRETGRGRGNVDDGLVAGQSENEDLAGEVQEQGKTASPSRWGRSGRVEL